MINVNDMLKSGLRWILFGLFIDIIYFCFSRIHRGRNIYLIRGKRVVGSHLFYYMHAFYFTSLWDCVCLLCVYQTAALQMLYYVTAFFVFYCTAFSSGYNALVLERCDFAGCSQQPLLISKTLSRLSSPGTTQHMHFCIVDVSP